MLERPKQAGHGDYACNVALQLAKQLKRPPREIADALVAALPASPHLEKAEVAGAGFINLFLKRSFKQQVVNRMLAAGAALRHERARPAQERCRSSSCRPIRPARCTSATAAARPTARALPTCSPPPASTSTREYYVNDAGRQMDILALSTWLRYLELCGEAVPFPANAYQGEYVRAMARALHARARGAVSPRRSAGSFTAGPRRA